METFISSMIAAGDDEKRPPNILLAVLSVTGSCPMLQPQRAERMEGQAPRRSASRTAILSLATAAIAAVVGYAAVYVTVGRSDNGAPAAQPVAQGQTAPAQAGPQELPK